MGVKRLLGLFLLVSLSVVALAQTPADDKLRTALTRLRENEQIYLRLEGTETLGTVITPIVIDLFFDAGRLTNEAPRIEMLHYRNSVLTRRTVGDGVTLWSYDPIRNEYTTSRYGSYQGRATDDISRLMTALGPVSTGHSAHLARLLREVYAGGQVTYRRWIPGAAPLEDAEGVFEKVIFASPGVTPDRFFTFLLVADNETYDLTYLDIYQTQTVVSVAKVANLRMSIPAYEPHRALLTYRFVAPAGARAVAVPR